MLKEFGTLARQRPLNAGVLALSAFFGAKMIYQATKADTDRFWNKPFGASTSTTTSSSGSHAHMPRTTSGDMMTHPTALFGYKNVGSHCTGGVGHACTNPHCHCGGKGLGAGHKGRMKTMYGAHDAIGYGDDSHGSAEQLFGVSSAIRRRVMINNEDSGGYNEPQNSHLFGHNQTPTGMTSADVEAIADMAGF